VDRQELQNLASSLKLGSYRKHVFLCAGPKCCNEEEGQATWEYLKGRLKQLGLADGVVFRTRVGCLRVCSQGPIALIYPEGTWYAQVTPSVCERVIQEHLLEGRVVAEHAFASNPLPGTGETAAPAPRTLGEIEG
jgi:(2Fe-2S) ferredoxin